MFNWVKGTEIGKKEGLGLYRMAFRPNSLPMGIEFEVVVDAHFTVI